MEKESNKCIDKIRDAASYASIDLLKKFKNQCDMIIREKDNCTMIHKQIKLIFSNQQSRYLLQNKLQFDEKFEDEI